MKKRITALIVAGIFVLVMAGCGDDASGPDTGTLTLSFTGIESLGTDYAYEGWIMVDGSPVSTGVFTVNESGTPSQTTFDLPLEELEAATTFILTIEPSPDQSADPAETHYLAGDFSMGEANLTVNHSAALGDDFSNSDGAYILATPTNGADTDESSGIWFIDITSGSPVQGLTLPMLPSGWMYEGWVVINGTPVTTGTFLTADEADDSAPYSGSEDAPPFPGEDFLMNAPAGLTFPVDLAGMTGVISIEPYPDNSTSPFTLKPLVGAIPTDATDHVTYDMDNNASGFTTGIASW